MIRLLLLFFSVFSVSAFAQNVWTEGTTWEVYLKDNDSPTLYELCEAEVIDGMVYYPLVADNNEYRHDTLAWVRAEGDDELVYARSFRNSSRDLLVYDFTKEYAPGDTIRYGDMSGRIFEVCIDTLLSPIEYYYDVIEEGDCLPLWSGIIYKIGYLEGPLGLFRVDQASPGEENDGNKPKTTNVSHVLFKRKGKPQIEIAITHIENVMADEMDAFWFSLMGSRTGEPAGNCFIISRGKKIILQKR